MPIKESAKKYMRVTERKTARNKIVKGTFKGAIKKTREAVKAGLIDDAQKWLKTAIKSLDKAAQKKILKKNTAARKKSRLNTLVKNSIGKTVVVAKRIAKKVVAKKAPAKKATPKKVTKTPVKKVVKKAVAK
jgi:small subunit ribosomal protein S20